MEAEDIKTYARQQFQAILDLPESKGRESFAVGLAKSGMSLDEAKKTLSMMPASVPSKDNRLEQYVAEQQRSQSNDE